MLPLLKEKVDQNKKINLYLELSNFNKIDFSTIANELSFVYKHAKDFHKVAVVGDQKLSAFINQVSTYLTSATISFFEDNQQTIAMKWVTENALGANEEVYKNSSLLD